MLKKCVGKKENYKMCFFNFVHNRNFKIFIAYFVKIILFDENYHGDVWNDTSSDRWVSLERVNVTN